MIVINLHHSLNYAEIILKWFKITIFGKQILGWRRLRLKVTGFPKRTSFYFSDTFLVYIIQYIMLYIPYRDWQNKLNFSLNPSGFMSWILLLHNIYLVGQINSTCVPGFAVSLLRSTLLQPDVLERVDTKMLLAIDPYTHGLNNVHILKCNCFESGPGVYDTFWDGIQLFWCVGWGSHWSHASECSLQNQI